MSVSDPHRVLVLAAGLALILATSPALWAAAPPFDIPYKKFVLDNGLTLVVHEDHKTPIIAINIWYHVGSKNEKSGKTGFAHLFEHLMFNGSENADTDWFKVTEPLGATDMNGTTSEDRTNYFENVPKSALDTILWMESDRMGHLLGAVSQAKLDEQRGVVQNEKRQGENQPYAIAYELMTTAAFPVGHPYSWSVIGSMEDLDAAALTDVHEWFKTYYGPNNAVLVIAGDVNSEEVLAKVKTYFGDIPAGPPIGRHLMWIAKRTGTRRQIVQDRVPVARIYKIWNTPPTTSPENDTLNLAAELLTSGKSSRLYKRLVYDDQIATSVSAYVDAREIASVFTITADAMPGVDIAAVEKAIDEELERFLVEGPTAAELARAKSQFESGFIRGAERIGGFGGKSDILAEGAVYYGDPDAWKVMYSRRTSATAAEIKGAANRWLADGQFTLTVIPYPELSAAKAGADRSKPPTAGDPPVAVFPAFQRETLSNGMKLMVAERHAVPVIELALIVDAGYSADTPAKAGTVSLAMAMFGEGTKTRNSIQISDELALLGAQLNASSDLDTSTVTLSALKSKLDDSLALYADVVLNPAFPQADFERLKKERLAYIEQEKADPVGMALRVFPALLYGAGHAYALPFSGSGYASTVTAITRDDLVQFHQTWFKPAGATLVVVGDTTLAEIRPRIEALFEEWQPGEAPAKNIPKVTLADATPIYIVDRPGSQQSIILGGQLAPPSNNPNEIALTGMNTILGGSFISRLNMNLREDKHWSYGAGSMLLDARGQRLYLFYAPVQTDKTKESMQEMAKEVRGITGGIPITDKEFVDARDGLTHALAGGWETAGSVAGSLGAIVRNGYPDDWFQTWPARVQALRGDDLLNAAKMTVTPDRFVWVVVGDRAVIESKIRELGWGAVTPIDPDGKIQK